MSPPLLCPASCVTVASRKRCQTKPYFDRVCEHGTGDSEHDGQPARLQLLEYLCGHLPRVDLSSCRAGFDRWMLSWPWPARSCRNAFREGILLGVRWVSTRLLMLFRSTLSFRAATAQGTSSSGGALSCVLIRSPVQCPDKDVSVRSAALRVPPHKAQSDGRNSQGFSLNALFKGLSVSCQWR